MSSEKPSPEPKKQTVSPMSDTAIWDVVFDTLTSGLMLLNTSGDIFRINQRAKTLLDLENTSTKTLHDFPDYLDPLKELLLQASADRYRCELMLPLPSRPTELSTLGYNLSLLKPDKKSASETILVFTFSDITQILKDRQAMDKIRDELHQSKKLASIGTMISGVAHEMNNPLTGISMSAELSRLNLQRLIQQLSADASPLDSSTLANRLEKTLAEVEKIARSCDKAAVLVSDLLSYSKPSQVVMIPTDYPKLVQDTIKAFESHPDFMHFKINVIPPEDSLPVTVLADRVKIEQVFYNLCKNACDAAEGQGKMDIHFTAGESPTGFPWLIAHVRDKGPGIDKTILSRIFDPFFSTKGNKGVGLGLSISYRTLEQHDGLLSVESEPGQWTEFQVALPLVENFEKT
ncbi:MAG: ATP-binding protein [Vampirovibrionales bacterium]|nr:ATP-binding protein [Vampirovibrionales bacterium]